MTRTRKPGVSRRATLAMMGAGAVTFATPWVARAQAKTIKVGMPTILSGRVAQLGTSSRNGVTLEVEKVNAAGGLAGRQIEMVIRDSKGQPQEAARVARELVNTDGCELLIDAEASSGAFAVHEVAGLKVTGFKFNGSIKGSFRRRPDPCPRPSVPLPIWGSDAGLRG